MEKELENKANENINESEEDDEEFKNINSQPPNE